MRKEVLKTYQKYAKYIGIEFNGDEKAFEAAIKQLLKDQVSSALADMMKRGLTKEHLQRMLKTARPLGDFGWFQKRMPNDVFQEFFSSPVRKFGLDGSLDFKYGCYGASTSPAILNISPWNCSIDTYEEMRGKPKKKDPDKEAIFDAGHWIEPVYRHYFDTMYGNRYIVIECDIQWSSRNFEHFIANYDGFLIDKETGQHGILEIKHTSPRNVKVIDAVKAGEVPEYWDSQERCYMEIMDASFSCLFLGWGNRPGLDTNAMARTERDKDLGEAILDQCEDFMVNNVEAGIKPSYKNIKNTDLIKENLAKIYPPNPKKTSLKLDDSFEANLIALQEAQKAIDEAKQAKKEAEEKVLQAEANYEALQIPIIEEMKENTKAEFEKDGTHYDISFDVRNGLNVEEVYNKYRAAYDACNKLALDTDMLKKQYPDVYSDCYGPKVGAKRNFKLRIWRSKK